MGGTTPFIIVCLVALATPAKANICVVGDGITQCCLDANDCDGDGVDDGSDPDDDNDGVCDDAGVVGPTSPGGPNCVDRGGDPNDRHPLICGAGDDDSCDDCSRGHYCPWDWSMEESTPGYAACVAELSARAEPPDAGVTQDGFGPGLNFNERDDGADQNGDGECEIDNDNDGVADMLGPVQFDPDPNDPTVCGDADNDGCDDCSVGVDGTGGLADSKCRTVGGITLCDNDGDDFDSDGLCDVGDDDIDGDGGPNESDPDDFNPDVCGDVPNAEGKSDGDLCDDCANGPADPLNDGQDPDGDGFCADHDGGDFDGVPCKVTSGCVDGTPCNAEPSECLDNCPTTANPDQADSDGNGVGDACEDGSGGNVPLYACRAGSAPLLIIVIFIGMFVYTRRTVTTR